MYISISKILFFVLQNLTKNVFSQLRFGILGQYRLGRMQVFTSEKQESANVQHIYWKNEIINHLSN